MGYRRPASLVKLQSEATIATGKIGAEMAARSSSGTMLGIG
jgi:hypothetical protein